MYYVERFALQPADLATSNAQEVLIFFEDSEQITVLDLSP